MIHAAMHAGIVLLLPGFITYTCVDMQEVSGHYKNSIVFSLYAMEVTNRYFGNESKLFTWLTAPNSIKS